MLIQNFTVLIESAVKQIVIPKHQKEKEVNQINVVKTFTILPHLLKQNESRQRKWCTCTAVRLGVHVWQLG